MNSRINPTDLCPQLLLVERRTYRSSLLNAINFPSDRLLMSVVRLVADVLDALLHRRPPVAAA
jgi:hypothetical protein